MTGRNNYFLIRGLTSNKQHRLPQRSMVWEKGFEPSRYFYQWILSPLRLPVSSFPHLY